MTKVFYGGFSFLFLGLFSYLAMSFPGPAIGSFLVLGLFFVLSKLYGLYERRLLACYDSVLFGFLATFLAVNMASSLFLEHTPTYDLSAIYHGAIEWTETGTFESFYPYFCYFPNNFGGLTVLHVLFSLFGPVDHYVVASMANSCLVVLTVLLAVRCCEYMAGLRAGYACMLIFVLSVPFWFMGAVFYTDSLSMVFPVALFYLYLRLTVTGRTRYYGTLFVIVGVLGCFVKFTVCIMLIAVGIGSVLLGTWRKALPILAVTAVVGFVTGRIFDWYMYSFHLDPGMANDMNTPYLHWVMMGLQGDGGYNPYDYDLSRSFPKATQTRDLLAEIGRRLDRMGVVGAWDLFWRKLRVVFGSGTLCQSDFLDDGPVHDTFLHEFLLYSGDGYSSYEAYCRSVQFFVLLSAGVQGVRGMFRKAGHVVVPCIAMCGVCLFFAMWETSGRYATNFMPVLYIISGYLWGEINEHTNPLPRGALLQRGGRVARDRQAAQRQA